MRNVRTGKRFLAAVSLVILCVCLLLSGCNGGVQIEDSSSKESTSALSSDSSSTSSSALSEGTQPTTSALTEPSKDGTTADVSTSEKTIPTLPSGVNTTAPIVTEGTVAPPEVVPTTPTKVTPPPEEPVISKALTPLQPEDYYGYQLLKKSGDKDMLNAYSAIAEAVGAYQTQVELSAKGIKVTPEEFARVFYYYVDDYPQHFWREKGYSYSYYTLPGKKDHIVSAVTLQFNIKAADIPAARAAMEKKTAALLDGLNGSMSEFERERLLHDRLVKSVEYSEATEQPASVYTLYGALVNGSAVCEGYARAFQYLMYQAGIPCLIVIGSSHGDLHAWNIVTIDGQPYHMDATWNDKGKDTQGKDVILYFYFNITTAQIKQDHAITYDFFKDTDYQISYPVPDCTATAAEYHNRIGASMTGFSADIVAQQIVAAAKSGSPYVNLRSTLTPDDFMAEYEANLNVLRQKVAADGVKLRSGSYRFESPALGAVCIRYQ